MHTMPTIVALSVLMSMENGDKRSLKITTLYNKKKMKSAEPLKFKLLDHENPTVDTYIQVFGEKTFKYLQEMINEAISDKYDMTQVKEICLIEVMEIDSMNTVIVQDDPIKLDKK